ncbi:MAG: penicillin-binding protein [Clostridia bacterium]|nr:penicillin-binding protein [Clostridia bacterium]
MKLIRKIIWIAFLLCLAGALFFAGYYIAVTKNVSLCPEKLILSETQLRIYDDNAQPLQNTSAFFKKQSVNVKNIPAVTKNAFIATEDKRFFTHNGFDVKRIVKAAYNNLKSRSFKEGASTISQQLIKNTHLTQEKTFKRKLQEWKLTRKLEQMYTKDEILEKYLNSIYFGHNCFGLVSAAEFYFQKTPENLTLGESAILAGLVKSPNYYSPFKNPERCQKRKQSVLAAMLSNGMITEKERADAASEALPCNNEVYRGATGYMHFVFEELTDIAEQKGFSIGGNIEIFTYLDRSLQENVEKIVQQADLSCNKSIFIADNEKLAFKACVSDFGNTPRQPGSLIKPLLTYAPALEENLLSPATPILDEKIDYNGYTPENFDRTYHGYVSARECVEKSLNIPAVKVLSSLGLDKASEYMRRIGLPIDQEDKSLALALGGMKNGFTMQDIIQAYSVFPNHGYFEPTCFISGIRINGQFVYRRTHTKKRVFSEETAFLMTDMLHSTAKTGTAKKLRDLPFDIAAKTGTTGTKNNENRDAYALSYTTKDIVGVWLGNKDNAPIPYTGGSVPCNLLLQINQTLFDLYTAKDLPIKPFSKPSGVINVALDKNAYYATHTLELADDRAPISYRLHEWFKKDAVPHKKSTFFSNPHIVTPTLQLLNNKVVISFDKTSPTCYQYKIERYDYDTHSTLYLGDYTEHFVDETIDKDKNYVYSVTPIYKGNSGEKIILPTVNTNGLFSDHSEILQKNWWEY